MTAADPDRAFLRHTLATLAYRAEKALRDQPASFGAVRAGPASRSALELVGHLGDLMEWGERMARGDTRWEAGSPAEWNAAVDRFFAGLAAFDAAIAAPQVAADRALVLFQGPIADALTHVGQLSLLRGLAAAPVRPESYARAEIRAGRVGREQSPVRKEFDGDASKRRRSANITARVRTPPRRR